MYRIYPQMKWILQTPTPFPPENNDYYVNNKPIVYIAFNYFYK